MAFFIVVAGEAIMGLYSDDAGYAPPPDGAIPVSDADGERLRLGHGWYKYVNGAVVPNDAALLGAAQATAAAMIEAAYAAAIGVIADKYPATERDSWAKQEMEARAYVANTAAPAPILTAIAAERGMTLADLAASVIVKADSYAVYAGAQIGRRRARLDAIAAAATVADAESITW